MATIKLSTTGSANRLISYAEKKAVEREGVDCNPEYVKIQFATTRELYGKTDGVQAHHIIQSFAPGEITPDQSNKVGLDLARKLGKGYECVIYTHADKEHIHNHIVINSVSYEDGKKLHLHGKEAIDKVRQISDTLCKERGLSIIQEPTSKIRYTLAEQGICERGETSWKDELRQAIDYEKTHSKNYEDFKKNLTEKYNIDVNDNRKHITYKHPDHAKVVRGNKLGLDYERSTIEYGFSRQIERGQEPRTNEGTELTGTRELTDGNQRTQQTHAELHKSATERRYYEKSDDRKRTRKYEEDESRDTIENGIDITQAREHAENLHRQSLSSYGKWTTRNEKEQYDSLKQNGADRENTQNKYGRDGKSLTKQLKRSKERSGDLSR